ncbi:MAG: LamG domain-containing protein [Candidatus Poribacteria bacterium]
MKVRYLLIGVVVLFVAGVLTTSSYARYDPKTLAGIWLFDEGKGNTTADSSGNKNDGTFKGSPKWSDGKFSKCLEFDGASAYVDCGNGESLDITKAITVAAWVKFKKIDYKGAGGGLFFIASKGNPDAVAPNSGWWFSYDNRANGQGFPYTCFGNSAGGWAGGGNNFSGYNFVFDNGVWYHLAITVEKSIAKLYINGDQSGADKPLSNLVLSNTSTNFCIGSYITNYYFNGLIDDVAVFNVALTMQDIQNTMNTGLKVFLSSNAVDLSGKLVATWAVIKTQ